MEGFAGHFSEVSDPRARNARHDFLEVMFVALAVFCSVDRRLKRFAVLGRFWRADWPRFVALWRLGLPIGVTSAMEGVLFFGSAFIVGHFGAESLAAHALVMQLGGLSFMIPMGLSEAATIRVGL